MVSGGETECRLPAKKCTQQVDYLNVTERKRGEPGAASSTKNPKNTVQVPVRGDKNWRAKKTVRKQVQRRPMCHVMGRVCRHVGRKAGWW